MLRLFHNQLGILIAPFIFIASLTGLLYGLTPQLENFIYKEQLIATVKEEIRPEDSIVLKGSNGMGLIDVVKQLQGMK